MKKLLTVLLTTAALTIGSPIQANDNDVKLNALATQQMQRILNNSLVIESIGAQNKEHASLSSADIDSLDEAWRAGTNGADTTLIDKVLGTPLSAYLLEVLEEAGGLYSEIFVMDSRGLNVGQSGLTSDYWQGDESKWQKTYMIGPNAIHISETEFDESSQTYQNQVSVSVIDPTTQEVIGAATFGVNADALEYASIDDLD